MGRERRMLHLAGDTRPDVSPQVDQSFATAARWTACAAAIVSDGGESLAANSLASGSAATDPALSLLGATIIDLSLHDG
jgi:hypothetical protein